MYYFIFYFCDPVYNSLFVFCTSLTFPEFKNLWQNVKRFLKMMTQRPILQMPIIVSWTRNHRFYFTSCIVLSVFLFIFKPRKSQRHSGQRLFSEQRKNISFNKIFRVVKLESWKTSTFHCVANYETKVLLLCSVFSAKIKNGFLFYLMIGS